MSFETVEHAIFGSPAEPEPVEVALEGELPDFAQGIYLLNGPARFRIGSQTRHHWLDGDGMVRAVRFDQKSIRYRGRYVKTRRFLEESHAQQLRFRSFGTAFPGDSLRKGMALESPANVSVYPWSGKLLAFGEQSLPWTLDPETLETLGEYNFDGKLSDLTPLSAHPKFDPGCGRMYNFGIRYFGGKGRLSFYEFDARTGLVRIGSHLLPQGNSIHDFALSPGYACFHINPYTLDIREFLKEGVSLIEALHWDSDQSCRLLILSRETASVVASIPLPRREFCLHLVHAFDEEANLVIDMVTTQVPFFDQYYARPGLFAGIRPCRVVRFRVDTNRWKIMDTQAFPQPLHFDFPSVNAALSCRPYSHFWVMAMPCTPAHTPKFYDRLLRFDWREGRMREVFRAPSGCCLGGEPLPIADPADPERGLVMCQMLNLALGTSHYLFLDGFKRNAAPLAQAKLPQFDPLGFHTATVSTPSRSL